MKKKSLVKKYVYRLLLLGIALLFGITIISSLQIYDKFQLTFRHEGETYIDMIESQINKDTLISIINKKDELSKIKIDSVDAGSISDNIKHEYEEWFKIDNFIYNTFFFNDDFTRFQILIPDGDHFISVWHASRYAEGDRNPMSLVTLNRLENSLITALSNTNDDRLNYLPDNLLVFRKNGKTIGTIIEPILDDNNNVIAIEELDLDISQITYSILQIAILIAFFIIFTLAFSLNVFFYYTKREIMRPILQLNNAAKNVVDKLKRNEDTQKLNIHTNDEIESLSHSFESMEENLRKYIIENNAITVEREHIKAELNLATGIQADMLIKDFPPFPDRTEFDIYASMNTAKEVGGDFYDFFLINDNQLAIVIADVSGKGFPAALFMMRTMLMIESLATNSDSPAVILDNLNKLICKNNDSKMFVTVWLGILDINTGILRASNAGHEFPIIREPGKSFELYKDKHSFVIGGKKKTKFKDYELILQPGTKLFLYTDGVPEAKNAQGERFNIEPTIDALNKNPDSSVKEAIDNVTKSVSDFVLDAEQFDDLTMLCFEYKGNNIN